MRAWDAWSRRPRTAMPMEWLGMCDMMVVSYRMVLADLQAEAQVRATLAAA